MTKSVLPTFDVVLSGWVFLDIVFTDLPTPPRPGREVWTGGMGSSPGGIANLAVAAARLDLRTALAAAFSDDGYGAWCRDVLDKQEHIDLSRSRTIPGWHTPVTVSLAYDDDRAMITHGHTPPVSGRELLARPPSTRAVIADLGTEPWWQDYLGTSTLVFTDIGWDPTDTWDLGVLDRLAGCHAFMPNEAEAMAYTRTDTPTAALAAVAELVPLAVVTRGAQGVLAIDQSTGEQAAAPALAGPVVDPTGAGDVFGAALVTGTLEGWPLAQRLAFATLCASLAVRQFGGALAAPGWGDLADWWRCTREAARRGPAATAELARRYAFLDEVLGRHVGRAVRRADATIARLADM
ncbi:MAG: PfkB family carbohydrate kinase [Propionibacteriaceae bacterium]|jgi:sugar/nucleoside kinase (ribokinase family)|nr:PfkB family carbohydrate kinase [Propionibacteriaceae bacterium]